MSRYVVLFFFGCAVIFAILLSLPGFEVAARDMPCFMNGDRAAMVEASSDYIKNQTPSISRVEIEQIRTAFLNAPPKKSAQPEVYVPVYRTPEKEKVKDEAFFKNAVFLGDSITEGILLSGVVEDTKVVATKGMSVRRAVDKLAEISAASPEKLYVLLGINDLINYNMTVEQHVNSYRTFLEAAKQQLPNTTIYVQSVFPLAKKYDGTKNQLSNAKIDTFNTQLAAVCDEMQIRYIDVSGSIKDSEGYMLADLSSDGLHVRISYYPFWLNILMENS